MAAASTALRESAHRPPSSAHEIRAVAVRACRDPRTVVAAYAGRATAIATAGIAVAALELGYAPPPEARR